jgi:hypothetical protein
MHNTANIGSGYLSPQWANFFQQKIGIAWFACIHKKPIAKQDHFRKIVI